MDHSVLLTEISRHSPAPNQAPSRSPSLFGARVILAGVKTLEQLSTITGEYDRPTQTRSHQQPYGYRSGASSPSVTTSWTTRREPRLPPGEIAQLRQGQTIVMVGPVWGRVSTLPYDHHPAFAQLIART